MVSSLDLAPSEIEPSPQIMTCALDLSPPHSPSPPPSAAPPHHPHPEHTTLTLSTGPIAESSKCNVTLPTPRILPAPTRPAVPACWTTDDGYMRLCIAKGTLVPAKGRLVPARPAEP